MKDRHENLMPLIHSFEVFEDDIINDTTVNDHSCVSIEYELRNKIKEAFIPLDMLYYFCLRQGYLTSTYMTDSVSQTHTVSRHRFAEHLESLDFDEQSKIASNWLIMKQVELTFKNN